mgnify:CR=1 FL=1
MIRTYSELSKLKTLEERFDYLKLNGKVANETFGFDRQLNQHFYKLKRWKDVRNEVILRDNGCDLGLEGYELDKHIIIHHMNPITVDDILEMNDDLFNPEYLICVSHNTHNAIHYGDIDLLQRAPIVRRPGDTALWS